MSYYRHDFIWHDGQTHIHFPLWLVPLEQDEDSCAGGVCGPDQRPVGVVIHVHTEPDAYFVRDAAGLVHATELPTLRHAMFGAYLRWLGDHQPPQAAPNQGTNT